MARKIDPEVETQAVLMRELGCSYPAISSRLDISLSSAKRIAKKHQVNSGSIAKEVIDKARAEMVERLLSNDAIQKAIACLLQDTLVHVEDSRQRLYAGAQNVSATDLKSYQLLCRAESSRATAIKLQNDTLRSLLSFDEAIKEQELPELIVTRMSEEDVAILREQQKMEYDLIYGKDTGVQEEDGLITESI